MDSIEVTLADLGEEATKRIAHKKQVKGLKENIEIAKIGGNVAKVARDELERQLDETVISSDNELPYKYEDNNLLEHKQFSEIVTKCHRLK